MTGAVTSLAGWRWAFIVCSIGVYCGAALSLIVFKGYRPMVHATPEHGFRGEVLRNKPAFLMILGYGSHMWEMYGMRSWLAPFFTAALVGHGIAKGIATGWAATAAAVIIGIGTFSTAITGTLSDILGRTRTIFIVMCGSAMFSFAFGWLVNANPYITFAVGIVYGYLIVAESPVFSAGLTELVAPGYMGAAMGLQSLVGYSLGMISPTVFGWALDLCHGWQPWPGIDADWGVAFATAGLAPSPAPSSCTCCAVVRKASAWQAAGARSLSDLGDRSERIAGRGQIYGNLKTNSGPIGRKFPGIWTVLLFSQQIHS